VLATAGCAANRHDPAHDYPRAPTVAAASYIAALVNRQAK